MASKGRIAMMSEPEKLEFQEYDLPVPGPGAVLVEVLRSNVCGSEVHIWCGHHPSKKRGGLGHEMIGTIAQLGDGVSVDHAGQPVKVGDRIVSTYFIACKKCNPCQHGQFNLCTNAYQFWGQQPEQAPHFHATFSTHYYIHPDQYFYKVPDEVSDRAAASANCALSQVYFGIEQAELSYGETVVIQGAGGLGLNAAAVAKEKGCKVIVIDAVASRLAVAKQFGADHIIDMVEHDSKEKRIAKIHSLTNGLGADLVIEVAGVPAAFAEGFELARAGGRFVTIGNVTPGQTVAFDPGLLTRLNVKIFPVLRYQPWYLKKSLDFLANNKHKYPFESLLDAEFSMDEIEQALA
jgi:threonine dehydrogenase-like Zn-dependent dehydrogenase